MLSSLLLSLPDDLLVDQVRVLYDCVTIGVRSTAPSALCPLCSQPATRIQSRYLRTVADLSSGGRQFVLSLVVRKFFCQTSACLRRLKASRFPDFVRPWARMTLRLCAELEAIGFATSGEGGARLAPRLGMPTSPPTMLRRLKAASEPPSQAVTKGGIDDVAFRRGLKYGTLLVDVETHQVIDLFPDRPVATAPAWFKHHPDSKIGSRDRGSDDAAAAAAGAPQALQVGDRWHLLGNLSEDVATFLARMRAQIRKASQALAPPSQEDPLADRREREALDLAHQTRRDERRTRKPVWEHTKEARAAQRLDQDQHVLERMASKAIPLPRLLLVWAFPSGRCADCDPKGSKPDPAAGVPALLISMLPPCAAVGKKDARVGNVGMKNCKERALLALLVRSLAP